MINRPKYKIARRLGAGIFDKTQSQKFALSEAKRKVEKRSRAGSEYGAQLLEKQKARYFYGINERQFAKYVKEAINSKGSSADENLFVRLETRLDNVVYKIGLAKTRQAARQMVSHGHILVNGVKTTIPSFNVSIGDKLGVRVGSLKSKLFTNLKEEIKDRTITPSWLKFDIEKMSGDVQGLPKLIKSELIYDVSAILEFYRR